LTDISVYTPPSINLDDHRHHFETLDIPQEQADELLQIIFEIMLGFVDMGLGIHPVQDCLLSTLDMATGSSDNTLQ